MGPLVRAITAAAAVAAVGFAVASCKPKEGGSCSFTGATCTSKDEGLFCEHSGSAPGKLHRYRCRGPKGCYRDGSMYKCDQTQAVEGDHCDPDVTGAACDIGGPSMLHCVHGTMAKEFTCRGPQGCGADAGRVTCDTSLSEPGDPCGPANEGKSGCTPDHAARVDCFGGTHVLAARCEGPGGCSVDAGTVNCDNARMQVGAACTGEGLAQCAADRKSVMHCRSGRLAADGRACLGAAGCYERDGRVNCDQSIAEDGTSCATDGEESCTKDGSATVVCKGGNFTRDRSCAHGCTVGTAQKGFVAPVRCR
jgi:hypothetical protein